MDFAFFFFFFGTHQCCWTTVNLSDRAVYIDPGLCNQCTLPLGASHGLKNMRIHAANTQRFHDLYRRSVTVVSTR